MNHPDWPAFLAAICAEPDDDTPRLVAADFLDENGEHDRAAFVRAQVELARLNASGLKKSPEAHAARSCEQKYLGAGSDRAWTWATEDCPELASVIAPALAGSSMLAPANLISWRRGFIEMVDCKAAEWLRYGIAVRKRNPVRDLFLSACERVARDEWEAHLDAFRGLRMVDVSNQTLEYDEALTNLLRPLLPGTNVTYIPF